jgi:hypothetical protein
MEEQTSRRIPAACLRLEALIPSLRRSKFSRDGANPDLGKRELRWVVVASSASNQTLSDWIREMINVNL